jgi:hypothetical protein
MLSWCFILISDAAMTAPMKTGRGFPKIASRIGIAAAADKEPKETKSHLKTIARKMNMDRRAQSGDTPR